MFIMLFDTQCVHTTLFQKFVHISDGASYVDAFDTEQLLECVGKLQSGQSVQVPIYDFKTHQRRTDTFRQVLNVAILGL